MNKILSKYFFYLPTVFIKREPVLSYLKEAKDFEKKSTLDIERYQLEKFKLIFSHAKSTSSFYRERFRDIDVNDIKDLIDIRKIPLISKSDMIQNLNEIQSNIPIKFEAKTTGGSTGQPVTILKNITALARERAVTWRAYAWAGIDIGDPQGRFWGVPHTKTGHLKSYIADLVVNRKRISAFSLDADSLSKYYHQLQRFRPRYLYGYVSVIEALAHHMLENNLASFPTLQCIITTSEVLYPNSREKIEKIFKVKVYNEYGCGEVGSIAHECEHGSMHIMADNLLIETSDSGQLIVTDFFNLKTPIIRYSVGDHGSLSKKPCACGRSLPVLENIYGRAYDIVKLKSGKTLHPEAIIYVIEDYRKKRNVLKQFQAIQINMDLIQLNVIKNSEFTPIDEQNLTTELKRILNNECDISFNYTDKIEREPSGKMRVVKSLLRN